MNNIYWCDAGEMNVFVEVVAEWPRYEWENVFGLVSAPTRGKARVEFIKANSRDLEWLDQISIRKLGEADIPTGDITSSDLADEWWPLTEGIDRVGSNE